MGKTARVQRTSLILMGSYSNISTKPKTVASQEKTIHHCILMRVWMQVITVTCTWGAIKMFMVMVLLFFLAGQWDIEQEI